MDSEIKSSHTSISSDDLAEFENETSLMLDSDDTRMSDVFEKDSILQITVESFLHQIEGLKAEKEELKASNSKLLGNVVELNREVKELHEKMNGVLLEAKGLESQLAQSNAQLQSEDVKLKRANAELETKRKEIVDLKVKMFDTREKHRQLDDLHEVFEWIRILLYFITLVFFSSFLLLLSIRIGSEIMQNKSSDRKWKIDASNMPEEMRNESIASANKALDMHGTYNEIAGYIKHEFDSKHGHAWNCIVGRIRKGHLAVSTSHAPAEQQYKIVTFLRNHLLPSFIHLSIGEDFVIILYKTFG